MSSDADNESRAVNSPAAVMDRALVWLMLLRVVVVTALLGLRVVAELIAQPSEPVVAFYLLIAATYVLTLFYAFAWTFTSARRSLLAYVQILGDLFIITAIVYVTGGLDSSFASLYFISIIAASIILFRIGGIVTASVASVLFAGLIGSLYLGFIGPYGPPIEGTDPLMPYQVVVRTVFPNIFGFFTVALLTSYLSENLYRTGQELEEASGFLADLQAFNQTIIDSITSGLMTTDMDGRVSFFNETAATVLARPTEEAVGERVTHLLRESDDFLSKVEAKLVNSRYCRMEGAYLDGNGKEIYLGMSISYLLFQGETKSGFLIIFQDLTEIKRLEREIRLKENLATMGEMAAGMAHEIRNPLASISGSVQVLKEVVGLSGDQTQLMDIIIRESARLSGTLTEFLAYSKPPQFEPAQIDLRSVIDETATLLNHSAEVLPEHDIRVSSSDSPVMMFADPNQMKQITWNLARNALQAMPDGGALKMSVARNGSGEVVMAFRDEGVGMTDVEVHNVFEPFSGSFERGSGLGLAIVYRIVKDYNGVIQVDSIPAQGTEVSVRFPLDRRTIG